MTELMNSDEDAPDEFFIFVDQLSPFTYHNFQVTGRFCSGAFGSLDTDSEFRSKYLDGTAQYLPFSPCEMDLMTLSPYFLTAINDYRVEYDAERIRLAKFPLFPSRMSALYAFGDMESCEIVGRRYGRPINTVRRFHLMPNPFNRIVRVNMEHVSLARLAYRVSMGKGSEDDDIWTHYWSGSAELGIELPSAQFERESCNSGVIWEFLVEGVVERIDHAHNKALQRTSGDAGR